MTFTALDLNITDEDRKAMYNEVMSHVDDNYWHYNELWM